MTEPSPQSPLERLADLESRIRLLSLEVQALGRDLRAAISRPGVAPPVSAAPASPASPRPAPTPRPTRPARPDLEQLVGRYGTVAIATLAILLGVGAFLQWAIARGLLGPEVRVLLGALLAIGLAAMGMRLRGQGTVRFGNVLLAIALAVAHVVAWAAGPSLGLIPDAAALVVAALASVALAVLALGDGEEWLFSLGVGGALLAPFVTLESAGGITTLLVFGWVIISAAIVALNDPGWRFARVFITAGASLYAAAGIAILERPIVASAARLPALFALGLAISTTLLAEPSNRRNVTRAFLALMALALLAGAKIVDAPWQIVTVAFVGTLALLLMRRRAIGTPDDNDGVWDATILPIAFLLVATWAFRDVTPSQATLLVAPWVALAGLLAWTEAPEKRALHLAVVFTAIELLIVLAADGREVPTSIGSSVVALAILVTLAELRRVELLIPLVFAVLASTMPALEALQGRPHYSYTPFATLPSLAGLGTSLMWIAVARVAPRDRPESPVLRSAGVAAVFVWGTIELSFAFSRDLATFLQITYFALFGVVAIGIGRQRGIALLRNAGLAIALFAALKAVLQASDLSSIGLRVGSYLVVGAFLLGVGYWYRAGADRGEASTADVR